MRIPEGANVKEGEVGPIRNKHVTEQLPSAMQLMAVAADLLATLEWKVENLQLMIASRWTKSISMV